MSPSSRPRDPRAAAILARHGHGALLPFLDAPDKRWFFAPYGQGAGAPDRPGCSGCAGGAACHDRADGGLVVFGRAGRVVVALGDPIGSGDAAWSAFDEFVGACDRTGSIPGVYQVTDDARPRLEERGFRCAPIGREALVDLATFDLSGPRRANVRHTVSRARRGGVRVDWYAQGLSEERLATLLPDLALVDARWRAAAGPAMGFTISRFGPGALSAPAAVAIATGHDDRPLAFATFRPTGADGGYVLDLLRRLPGGVPGALEFCVAGAAAGLREAGVPMLSLGLAPLAGLNPGARTLDERMLARATSLMAPLYDAAGLAFFKDKFAPRWERRDLAARGTVGLAAVVLGLLRLHLAPPGTRVGQAVRDAVDGLVPRATPREDDAGQRAGRRVVSGHRRR